MEVIVLLLLLAGAVCLALATLGAAARRINLLPLGLLCWIVTAIIPAVHAV